MKHEINCETYTAVVETFKTPWGMSVEEVLTAYTDSIAKAIRDNIKFEWIGPLEAEGEGE